MESLRTARLMGPILAAVVISTAAYESSTRKVEVTTRLNLTPRNFNNEYNLCTTKTGITGQCVDWTYCNNDHEIELGGIIDESELRTLECIKGVEWCCANKSIIMPPPPKTRDPNTSSSCIVSQRPDCPWCVKLYRDGKDSRRLKSGFFCMGTLIGTRVILSTGTCLIQAQSQNLWARIPNSPDPNHNYTVKFRLIHPKYNSGTRANDLALFTLDTELEWDKSGSKGACLGLEPNSLVGECIAAGIDDDENIDMTPVIVTEGNCGRGDGSDASCGHAIGEDCSIISGTPIMCRPNKGPFMMTGLAKLPCIDDPPKSLLNNLVQAGDWLKNHLKGTMGLDDKDFLKLGI